METCEKCGEPTDECMCWYEALVDENDALRKQIEEQEGWLHSCPTCGMKCKECQCVEKELTALRRKLEIAEEALRWYAYSDNDGWYGTGYYKAYSALKRIAEVE